MKNRKFITSLFLASIFFAPGVVFAEDTKSNVSVGEFVNDSAITTQIKAKILATSDIDSLRIKVDTDNNGIVVLSGAVKTETEKETVHNIAHSVDGVKKVINKVEIIPNP